MLYVVDGTRESGEEERAIQEAVRGPRGPWWLCLNKRDAAGPELGRRPRRRSPAAFPGSQVLQISALTGDGARCAAKDALSPSAPRGTRCTPRTTTRTRRPISGSPRSFGRRRCCRPARRCRTPLYVRMEDLEMRDGGAMLWARGFICVERESQKGIVVGRAGERIKAIVREAERELSEIFPYAVKLDMRVKVDRDWRKRDPLLKKMIR